MPEKFLGGGRPPFPLCNKNINIIVGEPIEFDLPKMRQTAISMSRNLSLPTAGWHHWHGASPNGMDEGAQRCLYATISEQIHTVMESLRSFSRSFPKSKA
jgi:monolysocardiolipin acyltransferase